MTFYQAYIKGRWNVSQSMLDRLGIPWKEDYRTITIGHLERLCDYMQITVAEFLS